jgi:hypothetical protein
MHASVHFNNSVQKCLIARSQDHQCPSLLNRGSAKNSSLLPIIRKYLFIFSKMTKTLHPGDPGSGNLLIYSYKMLIFKTLQRYHAGQANCIDCNPPYQRRKG